MYNNEYKVNIVKIFITKIVYAPHVFFLITKYKFSILNKLKVKQCNFLYFYFRSNESFCKQASVKKYLLSHKFGNLNYIEEQKPLFPLLCGLITAV